MNKNNIEKLQIMAQDFLQYRYKMWFFGKKRDADWNFYQGACKMIEAFGGSWRRIFNGGDEDDIKNYSHAVFFPDNRLCEKLNEDMWKD